MDEDDLGIAALFNQINVRDFKETRDVDWEFFNLIDDFGDIHPIECWPDEQETEIFRWLEDPYEYEQLQVEDEELSFLLTMIESFEEKESDIKDVLVGSDVKQPGISKSDGCWDGYRDTQDEDETTEITTPSASFVSESPLYMYYSPVPDVLLHSVDSIGL